MEQRRRDRLFVETPSASCRKTAADVPSLRKEIMLREKILDFLKRKPDYVSGDQISHRLGITRQALWKHIQILKDAGYDIVAVPHLGYKLISSPDRLVPFEVTRELNTKFIGKKIYY